MPNWKSVFDWPEWEESWDAVEADPKTTGVIFKAVPIFFNVKIEDPWDVYLVWGPVESPGTVLCWRDDPILIADVGFTFGSVICLSLVKVLVSSLLAKLADGLIDKVDFSMFDMSVCRRLILGVEIRTLRLLKSLINIGEYVLFGEVLVGKEASVEYCFGAVIVDQGTGT